MTDVGMTAVNEAFGRALDAVNAYLNHWLEPLGLLADEVSAAIEPASVGSLRDEDLAGLAEGMIRQLEASPDVIGHGFVAAPDVMSGLEHYLLWFQRRTNGIRRLKLNLSATDPDLYDYLDTDWFAGARRRVGPVLYGPYVDYAGADFLVLTIAVPVMVGERFVGVAGADLDPDAVESALVMRLRNLPGDAVIVTEDRSVVASGSARWMPGERLAAHPSSEPDGWLAQAALAPWSGWSLALAAPA
ncbi:hypothetical protein GCM10009798_36530 [Nocardioides panacihumi]|uniref:Cache domain-containing protein n=1 Tax=Nocardioides panacihumi TaxID=400774 RepID=A0ABP5D459_9ACTN